MESQRRELINNNLISTSLDFEDFWSEVFQLKNGLNELMFDQLVLFVGALLALPHSSATTERVFSQLNIIKTKQRNHLNITTVNAVMTATAILSEYDCHEWIPTPDLSTKYQAINMVIKNENGRIDIL